MSFKNTNNISQQMKVQIQNLSTARQSIQKSKDISGSMVNLSQTMNNLKPLMDKQSSYIKNFLQSQDVSNASSQQSQMRRYANRIFDITLNQINQLLNQAQNYFSLEMKNNWKKITNQIQKQISLEKDKLSQGNSSTGIIEFLFKTINIKDKLIKQFIQSIIFRKILLCKDLNIIESGYVHSEKKYVNQLIETYNLDKGFVPTKPIFKQFNFQNDGSEGSWSLTKIQSTFFVIQDKNSHISQFLNVVNIQLQEIFSIIRNYANLNQQQRNKSQIRRNDQQVTSLRQQIQAMHKNYYNLQKKYRDAVSKDEKLDITELKQRLREAQQLLQIKDSEIKQLKNEFREGSNSIQILKEKVSELTSDLHKVNELEMRKLKELQINQSNLNMQFSRIYQNIKNFGNIFQFENDGKKSLAKEIIAQKNSVEKMADMLGLQKRKNMQLKNEIQRLNQVILELGQRLRLKRIQQKQSSSSIE